MKNRATKTITFVRPANPTQYASGDLVANNVAGASVVVPHVACARFPGGNGSIAGVQILKSSASVVAAAFRVHFLTAAPTLTNGDNGALAITNGIAKGYLGHVDVTMDQAIGDGAHGRASAAIQFDTAAPSAELYLLIEARDTYTPASGETFTVKLELERD